MGLMNAMMDMMIKSIGKEKREKMMLDMMPQMMEGIDIYEFMPKMMTDMLKDVTVDDLISLIKRAIQDQDRLKDFADKIAQANLMQQLLIKVYKSKLDFDDTVAGLAEAAPKNGWQISEIRDIKSENQEAGLSDTARIKILNLSNPKEGHDITKDDRNKSMSVMIPLGVSVYETSDGRIDIAAMNLGMMSGMFTGVAKEMLSNSAANLEGTLRGVVE